MVTPRLPRARGLGRCLAAVAVIIAVWVTTLGAARVDLYARPGALPALSVSTLAARYKANRRAIGQALRTARRIQDGDRARALDRLLTPGRKFLFFDPRGTGRAVEVIGDLAHARRLAILVPGADTTLSTFDERGQQPYSTPGGGARALLAQARRLAPHPRLAVVAWLGYSPPQVTSAGVMTDVRADAGAVRLRRLVDELHDLNPAAETALLCHSYGSVVCGEALKGLPVDDVAAFGSPGMRASTAGALGTRANVWAARGSRDWMQFVPHVRVLGLGFGTDPVSPGFGARVFAAGAAGHGDYLRPGSLSLRNLALIALGRGPQVSLA
ncbi:alpha/beta hydrolase family protein [Actinoallomurus bryophytorum]|uniref:Alpha/beta hydrolase family protein n=1 Tax=Actinoallomurus bryophytorum TaxID=1490222 RepID=A0A543BZQ8_9ACTN|nr:alpha/beta hydrolase [Actinoallomurus bryophytorum]TQL90322.1 alpha/beta hydrolase family protein [Actinoallomurus bryophytorum]